MPRWATLVADLCKRSAPPSSTGATKHCQTTFTTLWRTSTRHSTTQCMVKGSAQVRDRSVPHMVMHLVASLQNQSLVLVSQDNDTHLVNMVKRLSYLALDMVV